MVTRRTSDSTRSSKPAVTARTKGTTPPASVEATPPVKAEPVTTPVAKTSAAKAPTIKPAAPKRATKPKPAPVSTAPAAVNEDVRRGMIAKSAYLRAEKRGFAPGGEAEDWIAAEKEVDALLNARTSTPTQ